MNSDRGMFSNCRHGSASTYRHGCRCDACRIASSKYQAENNQRRAARLAADPSLAPHGTESTYSNWLCRCEPCKTAHSQKMAEYAKRQAAR